MSFASCNVTVIGRCRTLTQLVQGSRGRLRSHPRRETDALEAATESESSRKTPLAERDQPTANVTTDRGSSILKRTLAPAKATAVTALTSKLETQIVSPRQGEYQTPNRGPPDQGILNQRHSDSQNYDSKMSQDH